MGGKVLRGAELRQLFLVARLSPQRRVSARRASCGLRRSVLRQVSGGHARLKLRLSAGRALLQYLWIVQRLVT